VRKKPKKSKKIKKSGKIATGKKGKKKKEKKKEKPKRVIILKVKTADRGRPPTTPGQYTKPKPTPPETRRKQLGAGPIVAFYNSNTTARGLAYNGLTKEPRNAAESRMERSDRPV